MEYIQKMSEMISDGSDTYSQMTDTWKMWAKEVPDLSEPDIQHVVSLEYALRMTENDFADYYQTKHDSIHHMRLLESKPRTTSWNVFDKESQPDAFGEFRHFAKLNFEAIRDSGLLPGFNFETLEGSIKMTTAPFNMASTPTIDTSFNLSSATYTQQCDSYDPENPSTIETDTLARGSRISQELFSQSEEAKALLHHQENQKLEIALSNARLEKSRLELEITQAKLGLQKSTAINVRPILLEKFNSQYLDPFVQGIETYLMTGKTPDLDTWLRVGSQQRTEMYWGFVSEKLISKSEIEFSRLLQNPTQFVVVAKQFLTKIKPSYKNETSKIDIVTTYLKFYLKVITQDQRQKMIEQWVKFSTDHQDIAKVPLGTTQLELVDEFVKINNDKDLDAPLQTYMMSAVRDRDPPITTLEEAFDFILDKWFTLSMWAEVMIRIGMEFKPSIYKFYTQSQDNKKRPHEPQSVGSGYIDTRQKPRIDAQGSKKEYPDPKTLCYQCGINQHPEKDCAQDPTGPYFNKDKTVAYGESEAWKKFLRHYPKMVNITLYPRIPRGDQFTKYRNRFEQHAHPPQQWRRR